MVYLLYTLIFLTLVSGTILYLTRSLWLEPFLYSTPIQILQSRLSGPSDYLYSRLPFTSHSFSDDLEAGLSSSNFDLAANISEGDARAGLDDAAKREILKLMKRRRLRFDEARRVYMEQRFAANGISADGLPRDPKFVSFS